MSQEFRHPHISFEPRNVIRVDKEFLRAEDYSPEELRDFVDEHEAIIAGRIERINQLSISQASRPELVSREVILIARLAFQGRELEVLNQEALQRNSRTYADESSLKSAFRPYWTQLEQTAFLPRIRTRGSGASGGTGGTWIGVTSNPS